MWFLLFVIILVIWLSERSSFNRKLRDLHDNYSRGWADGLTQARTEIVNLLRRKDVGIDELRQNYLGTMAEAPNANLVAIDSIDEEQIHHENEPQIAPSVEPTAVRYQPEPVLTSVEVAKIDKDRSVRSLNTMLYVGSFLIVSATALFVTLTMPGWVKLMDMILVTIAFYAVGLVLSKKTTTLKSAGTAFVGTGLAIMPFVGIALSSVGGISPQMSWLIISAVGLIAFGVSAYILNSQLISYLTMAFILSLPLSSVSTLGIGIVWYFIVSIGVSLILNSIHLLAPNLLPKVFRSSVRDTGQIVTPLALVASLLLIGSMDFMAYEVLFGLATAHYLVLFAQSKAPIYEALSRVLAQLTALIFTLDFVRAKTFGESVFIISLAWLGLLSAQLIYSFFRGRLGSSEVSSREKIWAGALIGLVAGVLPFWAFSSHPAVGVLLNFVVVGIAGVGATISFRQINWLYTTLASLVALPFVIGREIIEPAVSFELIAVIFALFSSVALVGLDSTRLKNPALSRLLTVATSLFGGAMVLAGLLVDTSSAIAWTTALAMLSCVALSYIWARSSVQVVGAVFGIVSVFNWTWFFLPNSIWSWFISTLVSVSLLSIISWVHHRFQDKTRRDHMLVVASVTLGLLIVSAWTSEITLTRSVVAVFLLTSVLMLAMRGLNKPSSSAAQTVALGGYIAYPMLACLASLSAGSGWLGVTLLVATGVAWASSMIERAPVMMVVGNILLPIGLSFLWYLLKLPGVWAVFSILSISATVYYLSYWLFYAFRDQVRYLYQFNSAIVALILAIFSLMALSSPIYVLASSVASIALSAILFVYGSVEGKKAWVESAIYVGVYSLQRLLDLAVPGLSALFYAHWWVVALLATAFWRQDNKNRITIALSIITLFTGFYALTYAGTYPIIFLIEHIVIIMFGGALKRQWVMWWGVSASIIAVLYFLRSYTAVWLLFLGLMLILFVVWRLLKINKS